MPGPGEADTIGDIPDIQSRSHLPVIARGDLAAFLKARALDIRAVARRKLLSRTRRVYDSEDVLSSTVRRMDQLAHEGKLRPHNDDELWTLTRTIAHNDAVSKNRIVARLDRLLAEEGPMLAPVADFIREQSDVENVETILSRLAATLNSSADRQYFFLRMRGATHKAAAEALGIGHDAARQRWVDIMAKLRSNLGRETSGD